MKKILQNKETFSDAVILIPARYASSRFPGKPLALINGSTLISIVANICIAAIGKENVFVVTDDLRIIEECNRYEIKSIMSSGEFPTGTDRIASVAHLFPDKIIINVQGDEPCIKVDDIHAAIKEKRKYPNFVINGYCDLKMNITEYTPSIPKVVFTEQKQLIYMSRANVPFKHKNDNNSPLVFHRQVCIYAFNFKELQNFINFGRRSYLEDREDIEILRFLDLEIPIRMISMNISLAVDYPEDIKKVESFLNPNKSE